MKIQRREASDERRLLIGMITDPVFLSRVSSKWEGDMFRSDWSNQIAKWCIEFYSRYEKAPGKQIEGLYEAWAGKTKNADVVKAVSNFLGSLSAQYENEDSNPDYLTDVAGEYFNRVRISKLVEQLQGDTDSNDVTGALKRLNGFAHLELGRGAGINVFDDKLAIRSAFESKQEPLIKLDGALGSFFGDALERDGFVALMGPEKRGKTFWLIHLAWSAVLQGRKVAMFEVGDMSQNQIMRRLISRALKQPIKPRKVKIPKFITYEEGKAMAEVDMTIETFETEPTWKEARKRFTMLREKYNIAPDAFKLRCDPMSSVTVGTINTTLKTWEREHGWVPDVIVIDYVDILQPMTGMKESRDQINDTWKRLRGLSQSYHALVITATQADAASYDASTLSMTNFSEDKRKYGHVTAMAGLNQTPAEKKYGITRLNWIVLRESDSDITKCVHCAGSLSLTNPAIVSTF